MQARGSEILFGGGGKILINGQADMQTGKIFPSPRVATQAFQPTPNRHSRFLVLYLFLETQSIDFNTKLKAIAQSNLLQLLKAIAQSNWYCYWYWLILTWLLIDIDFDIEVYAQS